MMSIFRAYSQCTHFISSAPLKSPIVPTSQKSMASLSSPQTPTPLLSRSSTRPSVSPAARALDLNRLRPDIGKLRRLRRPERANQGFLRRVAVDESDVLDPAPETEKVKPEDVALLKIKLLSAVSGLNRGLAAKEDDLINAESAAKELEDAGGLVDLYIDLDKLQGRWKLVYSSAFSSRTLGGSRPGPPTGRLLPITLGQVFQRIDVLSRDFDNIAELQFDTPWPLPPLEATAELAHKFELVGSAKINIIFQKTTVKPTGSISQLPPLDVPRLPDGLRPPSNPGSGEFEVTYLDSDIRITRGDRGELRVFVIA